MDRAASRQLAIALTGVGFAGVGNPGMESSLVKSVRTALPRGKCQNTCVSSSLVATDRNEREEIVVANSGRVSMIFCDCKEYHALQDLLWSLFPSQL